MTTTESQGRIRAVRMLIDKGACRYDGQRHLERLFAAGSPSSEAGDADRAAVIARIKRALRAQRQLGRAGHWSYDLNRHFGLLQALKAELAQADAKRSGQTGAQLATAASPAAPRIESAAADTGTETS